MLPGRAFLRRMINLMKVAKLPSHHVRLTSDFKSDLQWWVSFLPGWNGRSILPQPDPSHMVTSDASGTWGCGAVSDSGEFFQVPWPESWVYVNIAVKEMVPIVIAVAIWGQKWAEHTLLVRSDNVCGAYTLCWISKGFPTYAPHPLPAPFYSKITISVSRPGMLRESLTLLQMRCLVTGCQSFSNALHRLPRSRPQSRPSYWTC